MQNEEDFFFNFLHLEIMFLCRKFHIKLKETKWKS